MLQNRERERRDFLQPSSAKNRELPRGTPVIAAVGGHESAAVCASDGCRKCVLRRDCCEISVNRRLDSSPIALMSGEENGAVTANYPADLNRRGKARGELRVAVQ